MKFIKKITSMLMIAAAAFAASCSDAITEDSADVVASSDREITFSVNLPATRGTVLTNETFDSFKIYVVYESGSYTTRTMSVNSNGLWVLSSPLTMPSEGSITFYAASEGEGIAYSDGGITYTMSTDVADQPSLVMAEPITLTQESDLNVAFSFDYALAAVGFKTGEGDYTLTGVDIAGFYTSATIGYDGTYTLGGYTETAYTAAPVDNDDANFFMIPTQDMSGATLNAYFTYYEDDKAVDSYTKNVTLTANEDLETAGMVYTYAVESKSYVAPDYITPGEEYENNDGTYELEDMIVGDDQEIDVVSNSTLTWASSKESVATVDSDGKVTAIGGGTATITATSSTDGVVVEFEVTVYDPIIGLSLSATSLSLTVGEDTSTFTATATYDATNNPEGYTVSYSSASTSIATVSTSGVVTPVAAGSAVISATVTGSVSGRIYSTSYTVAVAAGAKFNYNLIFAGDYINSSGTVLSSSSGAIGMVYYVNASEGYALLVSPTCSSQYYWASTTTTKFGATNTECGYYNGSTKYSGTAIGDITSAYAINKVWTLGTLSAFIDATDETKGHWYLPANQELAKMRTSSTLWTKIMTYTGTTGYNTFWSSTEASASNAYMTFNDINSSDYSSYSKQYSSLWPTRGLFRVMKF